MNDVLKIFLSLSLSGALLILTLLVCNHFVKDKLSRQWQYYIWLIVIARLLVPFVPETNLIGNVFKNINLYMYQENSNKLSQQHKSDLQNIDNINIENMNQGNINQMKLTPINHPIQDIINILSSNIWLVWVIIAVILFIRKITIYQSFVQYVKAGQLPVSDTILLDQLAIIAEQVGVKKAVELCINPLISSPLLIGFSHPCIVLPSSNIGKKDFQYTVMHELTHYKRLDMFYKWLVQITICLHWFNPLVYLMGREINKACEFSCDEAIISKLDSSNVRDYGKVLLNTMSTVGKYKEILASVTLSENKEILKERIDAIMKFRKQSKSIVALTIMLSLLICCGAAYVGGYTDEDKNYNLVTNPIKLSNIDIESGGKVSLGSQWLDFDTKCSVLLTWTGNDKLTILCTSSNDVKKSYFIENGDLTIFQLDTADNYTISVKNESNHTIKNVTGTIDYTQNTNTSVKSNNEMSQTVIYESVEMRKYDDYPELGIEGSPYIHDIKTNNTDKKIVSAERGMTAFDKEGNPLKLQWNGLDSSNKPSYYFLYDWDTTEILPYQTDDIFGGWSLDIFGTDSNVAKTAYILYCDKEITFDDGTVWKNPDFDKWLSTYEGKKVDVETLNNYYPFEQNIVFKPSK